MRDNRTSRDAHHVRSAIWAHLEPENDYFKTVIKVLYLKSGFQMEYNDAEPLWESAFPCFVTAIFVV
jgi:hypothetical protein